MAINLQDVRQLTALREMYGLFGITYENDR